MDELLLGIDVGTTAVKVALFDDGGQLVRSHTVPYPIHRPKPGWAEQDPLDWWRGCEVGIGTVLAGLPAGAVRSVGVVSQVNTHVFTDEHLDPLGPALIWQDQRCVSVARELDGRFTAADKRRIWGDEIVLDASFVGARAEWLAREHPEGWTRTRWVLSPKDFVVARLTGRVASDALSGVRVCGPHGYLPEAVALVDGLAARLPELLAPEVSLGRTHNDTGFDIDTVVVGTLDAFGGVYGTRTTEPGRAMITCGTSLIVAGASRESLPAKGIITFPPHGGLFVHAGPTQAAGDAVRWWSRVSGLSIEDVFATAVHGHATAVFTPYLAGERAPLWDADVRASFLGLTADTTRADLSRAVLTGVALSGRHVLEVVEQACGLPLPSPTLSGGGARSDLWAQIHADAMGRPVERLRVLDSAALGAALLGAVGAGIFADVESAAAATVAVERTFTPAADLDRLHAAYRTSYAALRDVHALLAGSTP